MQIINLYEFYQGGCESPLKGFSRESNRYSIMGQVIRKLCDGLVSRTEEGILMKEAENILANAYQQEGFFDFDWQAYLYIRNDLLIIKRFLEWLGTDTVFLASNMPLRVNVSSDTAVTLNVSLLVRYPNGAVSALIIKQGQADKSLKGKTVHTSISTDLLCMAAKAGLERKYPGILISMVFMRNEEDTDEIVSEFHIGNTRKSNVFTLSYSTFYEESIFQYEEFYSLMLSVLHTAVKPNCYMCPDKTICKMRRKLSVTVKKDESPSSYVIPNFTESQNKVVEHMDGPMLVCAGPGSGKTAVIVGRIRRLIEKDIDPEFILAITFTNKAASELRERCSSFCTSDEMPEICTLHALGYKILRKNEERIGKVQILTHMEQMKIISSLLEKTPRLRNFRYGTKEDLLIAIANKLGRYVKYPDIASFMRTENVKEDFITFAKRYFSIVRSQGYITFDEQIIRCNTLFKEYPEVLSVLQNRYRYIMVDEYQDIDVEQAKLIYALSKKGNIVAVGDDDQSIYSFRGGSNKYMLDFPKIYKNTKTVILRENFRSTQTLVDAACKVIGTNTSRIPKDILAVRTCSVEPQIKSGGAAEINGMVAECLEKGYSYRDIAILSSRNVTLEQISNGLDFPHFLEKSYLTEDRFFNIVHDVLTLYYNGIQDIPFVSLSLSFDVAVKPGEGYRKKLAEGYPDVINGEHVPVGNDPLLNMYRFLEYAFLLLKSGVKAPAFLDLLAVHLGIEDTASVEAVEDIITKNHIRTCSDLLNVMGYMVNFQDDTRIDSAHGDSVELTTSHDAKGKEYPVVIILDDFRMDGEESTRLYYVAMTRAKDVLFILKRDKTPTLLEQVGR